MITLEDLKPAEGSVKKSKRVGRGRSSGHGKTSCRGNNGEDKEAEELQNAVLKAVRCLLSDVYQN